MRREQSHFGMISKMTDFYVFLTHTMQWAALPSALTFLPLTYRGWSTTPYHVAQRIVDLPIQEASGLMDLDSPRWDAGFFFEALQIGSIAT